jgi:hypothetical protein
MHSNYAQEKPLPNSSSRETARITQYGGVDQVSYLIEQLPTRLTLTTYIYTFAPQEGSQAETRTLARTTYQPPSECTAKE